MPTSEVAEVRTGRKLRIDLILPSLYPKQRAAIYDPARYSVIEASTKSGKTVGALVWLIERTAIDPRPITGWWIAPYYRQAEIAYRRMKRGIDPRYIVFNDSSPQRITWKHNGASIWFRSAENPEALYGEEVDCAVVDEFTRCHPDLWPALRSTLTFTRGPVRFIGNVKGRKNWGYRMARRAEAGDIGFAYHKITAADAVEAGVLDADEIEQARRDLPERIFQELYMAEAADDEGNPFGVEAIRACIGERGDGPPVAWGWDLAKSVDWTVGIALNKDGAICEMHRWQGDWLQTETRLVKLTGDVPAIIDSTGVGDPVFEALARRLKRAEGFKFSGPSKQQIMEGLAVAIQQELITLIDDPILIGELEAFEYEYTKTGVRYSAPEGMHDDTVDALALAVKKWGKPLRKWTVY